VGEEAVTASKARTELRYAEQVKESRTVRFVAGRAFTEQGTVRTPDGRTLELWVDSLYDETMDMETVLFASPRYAELAADPAVRPWLALSSELVLVMDGQALRITTLGAETDTPLFTSTPVAERDQPSPTPSPLPTATAQAPASPSQDLPPSSPWHTFLQWLKDLGR